MTQTAPETRGAIHSDVDTDIGPADADKEQTGSGDARLSERLGLRLRIALFFVALGTGGTCLFSLALWLGWLRSGGPVDGYLIAGIAGSFGLLGLVAWVGFLFDEHVARPILGLSSDLMVRAKADVGAALNTRPARYLGTLAPAAGELHKALSSARSKTVESSAHSTGLRGAGCLEAVLRDLSKAVVLIGHDGGLKFFNREACRLLGPLRLDRSLARYVEIAPIEQVVSDGTDSAALATLSLKHQQMLVGTIRRITTDSDDFGYLLVLEDVASDHQERNTVKHQLLRSVEAADCPVATLTSSLNVLRSSLQTSHSEISSLNVMQSVVDDLELESSKSFSLKARTVEESLFPDGEFCDLTASDRQGSDRKTEPLDMSLDAVRLCFFDTETTGLNPLLDRIVQIAAVRVSRGKIRRSDAFNALVAPGRSIPSEASDIHGITADMVRDAQTWSELSAEFLDYVDDAVMVAHHASFDMSVLRYHPGTAPELLTQPVLCTAKLSRALHPHTSAHTLDALAERYGVIIDQSVRHTALGDALITAEVFIRMLPMLKEQKVLSVSDALQFQGA